MQIKICIMGAKEMTQRLRALIALTGKTSSQSRTLTVTHSYLQLRAQKTQLLLLASLGSVHAWVQTDKHAVKRPYA